MLGTGRNLRWKTRLAEEGLQVDRRRDYDNYWLDDTIRAEPDAFRWKARRLRRFGFGCDSLGLTHQGIGPHSSFRGSRVGKLPTKFFGAMRGRVRSLLLD